MAFPLSSMDDGLAALYLWAGRVAESASDAMQRETLQSRKRRHLSPCAEALSRRSRSSQKIGQGRKGIPHRASLGRCR